MSGNINNAIEFHYVVKRFSFPDRNRLKRFILQLFKNENKKVDRINYIFCEDDYLLDMNKTYLKHNTLTDIITFDLSTNEKVTAEIYISIERVKENSRIYKSSFQKELQRVIFHGALHLCGFKDKKAIDIKLMRQKEEEYVAKYGVSRGTWK